MFTISKKDFSEFSILNEFRIKEKFPDVIIKIQDQSFPCHRIVLAASMKYFQSMFCGEFVESEKKEIELEWENTEDFEKLLTYIYGGSISVSEANAYRLLKIALYFGSQSLEDSCANYIVENNSQFSLDSIATIFRHASITKNTILLDGLLKLIAENFVQFSKSEKLYRISGQDLLNILGYLKPEEPTVHLNFLSSWVKFHSEEERKLLPELLNVIGLNEGPTKEWVMKTMLSNAVQLNTEELVNGDDVLSSENEKGVQLPFLLISHDKVVGVFKVNTYLQVNAYKFQTGNEMLQFVKPCLLKSDLPSEYYDCKSLSLNKTHLALTSHSIYMHPNRWFRQLEVYVLSTEQNAILIKQRVFQYKKTTFPREQDANIFTMSFIGNNIYLYDHEFIGYNFEVNEWFSVCNSQPNIVFAPNLLSHDSNSLYIVGGKNCSDYSPIACRSDGLSPRFVQSNGKLLQHYDVRQSKWLQLPQMKYPRSKSASCIYNGVIYVSGGDDSTYYNNHNVEWYDITAGKWSEFSTPMPSAKMGHCLTAYDDQLWFIGGQRGQCNTWFSYSLKEHTWSKIFSFGTSYGQFDMQRILDVIVTD